MAKDADNLADRLGSENTGGVWSRFLAEEDEFDRRALWRLGSWAVGSVGAVIIALVASQSSIGWRHEQIASADLARQSQQIQTIAKENQSEARRLASAIDTLNSDRDRLYARVGVLEQGLDSVTGALARQSKAAVAPQASTAPATSAAPVAAAPAEVQKQPPAPAIAPVATTTPTPAPPPATVAPATTATVEKPLTVAAVADPGPATVSSMSQASSNPSAATTSAAAPAPPTPLIASKSMMGPPDPAAGKLIESSAPPKIESKNEPKTEPKTELKTEPKASTPPIPEAVASAQPAADETPAATESQPKLSVQRTEFGVDVGGANSVAGLRALWRGLLKSRANAPLAALRPIIVIKENSTGLGMQLRLVAGPLTDAAAAAKICAGIQANERPCETTVFEGQRLTMNGNDSPAQTNTTPPTTNSRSYGHRHSASKHAAKDEPPPPKPEPSTMSLIFGTR
jgi:hypothetical protein